MTTTTALPDCRLYSSLGTIKFANDWKWKARRAAADGPDKYRWPGCLHGHRQRLPRGDPRVASGTYQPAQDIFIIKFRDKNPA